MPHDSHKMDDPVVEDMGLRLITIVALGMLVFAVGFLIFHPNEWKGGSSELRWDEYPSFVSDKNSTILHFSVMVFSSELEEASYDARVFVNDTIYAQEEFHMSPGDTRILDYRFPIVTPKQANEVKVRVQRSSEDTNRVNLELIAWVEDK